MEEFIPLEAMMTSAEVTGWPAIVRLITNKIDFDTLVKCREVSTAFKYFLDNNRDVWIAIFDRVRQEYLDLLVVAAQPMSPEKVHNDHKSWMDVLEKIKRNGTIEEIITYIKAINNIKNFHEEIRQWLEERAREVEESNLALLAEMPFFMI